MKNVKMGTAGHYTQGAPFRARALCDSTDDMAGGHAGKTNSEGRTRDRKSVV